MGAFCPTVPKWKDKWSWLTTLNMMEQMRAANRPQNSGVISLSVGTFFFLTVTFQLAALHPVEADPRNRYSQLKWNLDPEQLLNLYYSRIPSYKQQRNNFVWQKRGPGSEFLGKRSDVQSIDKRVPGSEFLGKRVPGSEFLGKRVPGSEFLCKRVPGSEFLGKRVPGSEFLGKRSHTMPLTQDEEEELYHVMENLTNQKRTLEVPLPYAQNTDRLRYELSESDNH